jgi:hypothetical protein
VVADEHQSLARIGVVPFPQRGNHVAAVYSAKRPHIKQDNFAAQIGQS